MIILKIIIIILFSSSYLSASDNDKMIEYNHFNKTKIVEEANYFYETFKIKMINGLTYDDVMNNYVSDDIKRIMQKAVDEYEKDPSEDNYSNIELYLNIDNELNLFRDLYKCTKDELTSFNVEKNEVILLYDANAICEYINFDKVLIKLIKTDKGFVLKSQDRERTTNTFQQ